MARASVLLATIQGPILKDSGTSLVGLLGEDRLGAGKEKEPELPNRWNRIDFAMALNGRAIRSIPLNRLLFSTATAIGRLALRAGEPLRRSAIHGLARHFSDRRPRKPSLAPGSLDDD